MRRLSGIVIALLLAALTGTLLTAPAHAADPRKPKHGKHAHREVRPCSRGLVALTFDDGPSATVTPRLVRLLQRERVPATFFMIGSYVAAHPEVARQVADAGFAIGDHTWAHEDLTSLSDAKVRHTVRATRRALVRAGVTPTMLARPPYGRIDDRVRRVLTGLGYTPVLWTVDPRDWAGATTRQIEQRVIAGVRPHRSDVVLQHDGVANSPATLRAVGTEIRTLRRRGFCFAALDVQGRPTPPVPLASVAAAPRRVVEGDRVRLTVTLDQPTTRAVTVRVRPGGTVRIPSGKVVGHLTHRIPQDHVHEPTADQAFTVLPGRGTLPAADGSATVRVVDDDPRPVVGLADATVTASPLLPTVVTLEVRLDRASSVDTPVVVRTPLGRVRVVVPAYQRSATGTVTVPVGRPAQKVRRLPLRADGARATLTVRPPRLGAADAARQAFEGVAWPSVVVPPLF